MKERPAGYLTQCVGPELNGYGYRCDQTARLPKPAKWRCDDCIERYGPLKTEVKQ